jgi:hypothetical protein
MQTSDRPGSGDNQISHARVPVHSVVVMYYGAVYNTVTIIILLFR